MLRNSIPGVSIKPNSNIANYSEFRVYEQVALHYEEDAVNDWSLRIPYGDGPQDLSIEFLVGNLSFDELESETYKPPTATQIIATIENEINNDKIARPALQQLLHWSPFWIEKISVKIEDRYVPLVKYRLVELLISFIENNSFYTNTLEMQYILLLRQRLRFISAINDEVCRRIYRFHQHYYEAREAYATYLVNKTDLVELALSKAQPFSDNTSQKTSWLNKSKWGGTETTNWDIDSEILLLLFDDREEKKLSTWFHAYKTPLNRKLSSWIVEKGLLARNDLHMATRAIAGSRNPQNKLGKYFYKSLQYIHIWVFGWTILSAVSLVGTGIWGERAFQNIPLFATMSITSVIVGIGLPFFYWFVFAFRGGFTKESVFPLALRIPGMAFIGVLGIAGIADAYTEFGFNAFDSFLPVVPMILGALGATFFYIFFETSQRSASLSQALRKTWYLISYAWAATFWISFFVAWFVEPLQLNKNISINRPLFVFGQSISIDFVLFMSAFSLLVGTLTQLFWEDKSVAEPL